ncbi:bifunctional DNA primase/polymerase [Altericroceibacterium xinjiangense]|uniref:bifunctional DNA primase/polymerase n=1 Tax=Altericroceibacterium xinjiangense TaxID=762261 RepID=UPI000F7D980B|nr:bifunctional DNA primase/polymerase [Altericroceibacterium xinjiangense]
MTAQPQAADFDLPEEWRVPFALGFSVFPIPFRRKKSAIPWKQFQSERASLDTVRKWASRPSNVGIVTGAVSGILVLDLDSEEAVAEAERRGIPDTPTVRTSKGKHVYFQHPGGTIGNRTGLLPGWDIRGDGGYVVAPRSVHPSGFTYAWENPPGLFDLAPAPEWLLTLLDIGGQTTCHHMVTAGAGNVRPFPVNPAGSWAEAALRNEAAALASSPEGRRNQALNNAALKLGQIVAGGHLDENEVKRRLHATAAAIGLDADEIGPTIDSGFAKGLTEPRDPPKRQHVRPQGTSSGERGVTLQDFRAYMPAHSYIFAPSGEFWPASSVNSRIPPVPLVNAAGEPVVDKKGDQVELSANQWLDRNRPVEQLTWAPGEPQVVSGRLISDGGWIDRPGCSVFNLYRPPVEIHGDPGKAGPWIEHVRQVYPDDAEHLICWLAHRVQRPQEKINHAIVMGGAQGIGKDTILEPVKAAIGPWNFAEVSPQHMLGRFNGFVKSVILRVSEARDLGDVDRFAFYDHLKTYTAAPPDVLRVDEKHVREYSVFNVCGVIVTTNHKTDGIYLPADDRRHYVAWSDCTRDAFPADYWTRLYRWYAEGGIGHIAAYLAALPIDSFDAKAPPPKTPAFWDIVSSNQAPEDAELADALDTLGSPDAVTVPSIAAAAHPEFTAWLADRRNSRRIPHRLEECGYVAVRNRHAKDGLFKVGGKRCAIYARKTLSPRDQITAAEALAGR